MTSLKYAVDGTAERANSQKDNSISYTKEERNEACFVVVSALLNASGNTHGAVDLNTQGIVLDHSDFNSIAQESPKKESEQVRTRYHKRFNNKDNHTSASHYAYLSRARDAKRLGHSCLMIATHHNNLKVMSALLDAPGKDGEAADLNIVGALGTTVRDNSAPASTLIFDVKSRILMGCFVPPYTISVL